MGVKNRDGEMGRWGVKERCAALGNRGAIMGDGGWEQAWGERSDEG